MRKEGGTFVTFSVTGLNLMRLHFSLFSVVSREGNPGQDNTHIEASSTRIDRFKARFVELNGGGGTSQQ